MINAERFYIDGAWVEPLSAGRLEVIDPATEAPFLTIALGSVADVDRAVAAARRAFPAYAQTGFAERRELLEAIAAVYERRLDEMAGLITREMGAPAAFARDAQAASGLFHLQRAIEVLRDLDVEETINDALVTREPIGVCGLITPWNWPVNQIVCKVAPALASGCTMVLKPSEVAPASGLLFAEILHEAGVPAGVFNLVNGDGPTVGQRLANHPEIDMVSFTGSTRAGIAVAKAAADTVKRVSQELGGKSPNIILDDADFERAVTNGVANCFSNSGQSCNAPTRLLVPAARYEEALAHARRVAEATVVGAPEDPSTVIGPVVSAVQFDKIQRLIEAGIAEGARLVAGGPGRPEGLAAGYYVRPTVFAGVTNDMSVAREEIFGPVVAILAYEDEEEAIAIANDTVYGLAAYVSSSDRERARRVARRLRAGTVHINDAPEDVAVPFGGYKQSGNGRECGRYGFDEYLEVKAMLGYHTA
ncbi:aldehyde dehydrogenase family protein [Ancylobacter sp. TS-1]|uniref:aldehyde dehydrogenase family protein n=1 Tax=Ancylobacter sp. TS-1 TaxID=1850374 RepID=UPI001265D525|nr:aldehyde dehydrogenase family protein [Ancylobacter sp. TS-1]QFR33478.1 aldehyde dehydrogenase family protein [Ancylobacter sp. TS-1]